MKLLTLNSHSIVEPDYEEKLRDFSGVVLKEQPQVMALQEVSQSMTADRVLEETLKASGYVPCRPREGMEPAAVRLDNHALRLALLLKAGGWPMTWTWIPAKVGYGRYDEGLALFSAWPVEETDQFFVSGSRDYGNWKTRRALGMKLRTPSGLQWFGCVHLGWWQDEEEPFREQWKRLSEEVEQTWTAEEPVPVWLLGDCNARADVRGEGYDLIRSGGWYDTYELARTRDQGDTVRGPIDGWREGGVPQGMRIDYIWCSRRAAVETSRVICNGVNGPEVSDHYGVVAELR